MQKLTLVTILVMAASALALPLGDEEDLEMSLDLWLEEDRREVVNAFLKRLYDTNDVGDVFERAQHAFRSCDALKTNTNDCSGHGSCSPLGGGWYRCRCASGYYGPKCNRRM